MTPTKDHQAQEYAEKILNENSALELDYFGLPQAWLDGYTACEQSKEDSEATVIQGWVAKLREVLEKLVADGDIEPIHVNVDEIINRVKKER